MKKLFVPVLLGHHRSRVCASLLGDCRTHLRHESTMTARAETSSALPLPGGMALDLSRGYRSARSEAPSICSSGNARKLRGIGRGRAERSRRCLGLFGLAVKVALPGRVRRLGRLRQWDARPR